MNGSFRPGNGNKPTLAFVSMINLIEMAIQSRRRYQLSAMSSSDVDQTIIILQDYCRNDTDTLKKIK
ncbi:hypothetical protein BLOT_013014 [Blomia tropicalis]|nr:hypothetical protein BLOT_013014 [Blomia tropicalis]